MPGRQPLRAALAAAFLAGPVGAQQPTCVVPASLNAQQLITLTQRNCDNVDRALADFRQAIADGKQLNADQEQAWNTKRSAASAACRSARRTLNGNPTAAQIRQAASTAIDAWGSTIMEGKECCTLLGPPYCVDAEFSGAAVAFVLPFLVLIALFFASLCAAQVLPSRRKQGDAAADGAAETAAATGSSLRGSAMSWMTAGGIARRLHSELKDRWMSRSCLRVLPGASEAAEVSSSLFGQLCERFGFQQDNARNQYEHLLSLWRSQCAMVADRAVGACERPDENILLGTALGDLHTELLDGFLKWRTAMREAKAMPAREPAALPKLGGVTWSHFTGRSVVDANSEAEASEVVPQLTTQFAEVAAFLLVWGEAGNVRFMPEVLYFIAELMLAAEEPGDVAAPSSERSSAFLAQIVRPIYNVVFDELYESVQGQGKAKDQKKLKQGFEAYLPPNVSNYDDWNELFCSPQRLQKGIVLKDGTKFFDVPHKDRYAKLAQVDWRASLKAAGTKTHREVHSLWGVFATTHRVWLVHSVLFFMGLCLVAKDPPQTSDGHAPIMGRTETVRLAAVGLVGPIHAVLWFCARWQITGSALRPTTKERVEGGVKCRWIRQWWEEVTKIEGCCGRIAHILDHPPKLCLFIPVGTYAALRIVATDESVGDNIVLAWTIAHFTVSIFVANHLLLVPSEHYKQWPLTRVGTRIRCVRYLFWVSIFCVKFALGLLILGKVDSTIGQLNIARLGQQTWSEVGEVYSTTHWWANVLLWFVLWATTFLLFASDTQLWFTLACTFLGVAEALRQRGTGFVSFWLEDAMAKIPERFSRKVLYHAAVPAKKAGKERANFSVKFPAIWDRIVAYMRYEDDIDSNVMADLSFDVPSARDNVLWEHLQKPLSNYLGGRATAPPPAQDAAATGEGADGRAVPPSKKVKLPALFRPKNPSETCFKSYCCVPDPRASRNSDVQWRLAALGRGLGLPLPRPYRAPYIPGITVLIPHYGEQILIQKNELLGGADRIFVPLIHWLKQKYSDEFLNFASRMRARAHLDWPVAGDNWEEYTPKQWDRVTSWAAMRLQTLWRTVAGFCYYHPALQCHFEAQGDQSCSLAKVWDPSDCFTCMVSMQMYKYFNDVQLEHTNRMFDKFPSCFKVAFIDCADKGDSADGDAVHPRQERRYYSCLIEKDSSVDREGRRKPVFRIELPGYPILGDGKGDNQNHAIPFMRGHFSQCIDANQGGYFEQMMMLPCALGEFRSHKRGDGLSKRIIGLPEHITSDIGSIGDFAASAEVAFGTILQRSYAVMGARMHYGHPDIVNKLYMMQQGGVSKATKTINLSEDIFAGMDFTLRGDGRRIRHCEYFHLAKGRDMGFNAVLGFFSKLSSGTGEQVLSRQTFRLSQVLHLPEALAFYYAHAGYYLNQFFVSVSMPLLVLTWLLVLLSDCEGSFDSFQHCLPGRPPAAAAMADFLAACFSWLVLLFLVANSMPLLCELWLQRSLKDAFLKFVTSICTLSPLMFVFQAKTIGHYIVNEVRFGGATYVATGRGLPTERRPIIRKNDKGKYEGLLLDYIVIAFYDGATLLAGVIFVCLAGGVSDAGPAGDNLIWTWVSLGLTMASWLFAPFVFNPYNFSLKLFSADMAALLSFFFKRSGKNWNAWYEGTVLRSRRGIRRSMIDIGFFCWVLFLAAWYATLNLKTEALLSIYSEYKEHKWLHAAILAPPVIMSLVWSFLVVILEKCAGCMSGTISWQALATAIKLKRGEEAEGAGGGETPKPPELTRERTRIWEDGLPLAVSAFFVFAFDLVEASTELAMFYWVGWNKALMAGLILKWGLTGLCLFLTESLLRSRCHRVCSLPLIHWVRAHRMARDMLTSFIVVLPQLPIVLLVCFNDYVCPGCSAHQLLLYRDPGTVEREEKVFDLEEDADHVESVPWGIFGLARAEEKKPTQREDQPPAQRGVLSWLGVAEPPSPVKDHV